MKNFLINIFLIIISINSFSQDSIHQVKLIARPFQDRVLLRWAPTNPFAWQLANKYGYTIERITMSKANKLVKDRTIKKMNEQPLMPWPETKWESIVYDSTGKVDNHVAIAVQALFGSKFQLTENYSGDYTKAVEKVQENEKRFTFALFTADQSLKVAEAMGLLYSDNTIQADEKYLYRVYTNVPTANLLIDTGYVYTGPADYAPLPKPIELKGNFEDNMVTISWNRQLFENIYTDYQLERSDDGRNFYPLGNMPFVNTSPDGKLKPTLMYRLDSLPENERVYHYRVRGRTPFCEFGPCSDIISGSGSAALLFRPSIIKAEVINNMEVMCKWEIPEEYKKEVEYFSLLRSDKANGIFTELAGNLNPESKEYTDKQPLPGNYYIIRAFNSKGQAASSFPVFAQLVDSFPPARPLPPIVSADTSGIVRLSWNKSAESDVMGYRVFRANFSSNEFGQVTGNPVKDTVYFEKIELDNLEPAIYYKIAAVDYNFNQSELSIEVKLLKPDTLTPAPPIFKSAVSTTKGPVLSWIKSSSRDIASYHLNRRAKDSLQWVEIAVFQINDTISGFSDTLAMPGILMEYAILAKDMNGNKSLPAKTVFAKKIDNGIRPAITDIKTNIDRSKKQIELSWKYPYPGVKHFLIYRSADESPVKYYKLVEATQNGFIDKETQVNTKYKYKLKAVFIDGSESGLSIENIVGF